MSNKLIKILCLLPRFIIFWHPPSLQNFLNSRQSVIIIFSHGKLHLFKAPSSGSTTCALLPLALDCVEINNNGGIILSQHDIVWIYIIVNKSKTMKMFETIFKSSQVHFRAERAIFVL